MKLVQMVLGGQPRFCEETPAAVVLKTMLDQPSRGEQYRYVPDDLMNAYESAIEKIRYLEDQIRDCRKPRLTLELEPAERRDPLPPPPIEIRDVEMHPWQ